MTKRNGNQIKIGRDAKSGQFVPVSVANRKPATTVVETIKRPPSQGKK